MTPRVEVWLEGGLDALASRRRRGRPVSVPVGPGTSVKDLIESIGIPHTEVGAVARAGRVVPLSALLRGGERLVVYPVRAGGASPLSDENSQQHPRFALDVHLGRLARYLRLLGFDSWWRREARDDELVAVALGENRLLLTRDRGLLKRRVVSEGYLVRETEPRRQVDEVLRRFDLFGAIEPFGRCIACNGVLEHVAKAEVLDRLLTRTRVDHEEFERCPDCGRVYWKGSHYDRLQGVVEEIRSQAGASPNDLRRAALEAAGRGWSIVPLHGVVDRRCSCGDPDCATPGKHPRITWEGLMQQRATATDIEAWWRRWPRANVGVVTGGISGLVVLDVDPRHGGTETLAALENAHGALPLTVESQTGGGGEHRFFVHPGHLVHSRSVAPGLDLKADGGLVVAPPSMHASGRAYRWTPGRAPEDLPLAPPPAWLLLAAGSPRSAGPPGATAREVPLRTSSERREFAELFARLGIEVRAGDHSYRCPFHPDRHPSLHVDADGCRFYCFGCGRGGGLGRLRRVVSSPGPPRPPARGAPPPGGPVTLEGSALVEVVGSSRHQDELLELAGGRRRYRGASIQTVADLYPGLAGERAVVAVTIGGRTVGELSRADVGAHLEAITAAIGRHGSATCRAMIVGGWERARGDIGSFGVRLMLAPVESSKCGAPEPPAAEAGSLGAGAKCSRRAR